MTQTTKSAVLGMLLLFFCSLGFARVYTDPESGLTIVEIGPAICSDCVEKRPLKSSPCSEGGCVKEPKPKAGPPPAGPAAPAAKTPQQVAEEKRKAALAEYGDAARALMVEEGDPPLQDTKALTDWLIDQLKDKILGPVGEVLTAIDPDDIAPTPFDKPKTVQDMKALRVKLDMEEKDQAEKNKKAYEENLKKLFPDKPAEAQPETAPANPGLAATAPAQKKLARVEAAVRQLASLKGDDFLAVTDHVLRRGRAGSPTPLSAELSRQVVAVLAPVTRANACMVTGGACILLGVAKGDNCYCPRMTSPTTFTQIPGKATRRPLGQYCRRGDVSDNLNSLYPLGVGCFITVNTTVNPAYPRVEYLPGRVSR